MNRGPERLVAPIAFPLPSAMHMRELLWGMAGVERLENARSVPRERTYETLKAELGVLVSNNIRCRLMLLRTAGLFHKGDDTPGQGGQLHADGRSNPASYFTRLGHSSGPPCPLRLETPGFNMKRQLPSPVSW
ncbi:hypothetical protein PMIN04_006085 [Paraphaeosphaeria minitans]